MRLGVDLGTTWTAAAAHASEGPEAVQLAGRTIAMPSVVAVDDGTVLVGEDAEAHLVVQPAAGAREFKRRLGDTTPYVLGGTPYGADALMGRLLRHVIDRAEAQVGEDLRELALTHPANWGAFKLDLLREAARLADVEDLVTLVPEPVAAVRHHVALGGVRPGQTVAAFDVGGGTVDVAIVRAGDGTSEVLGRPEGLERLGGVDVDHLVLAHVDAVLDGKLRELDATDPAVRAGVARLRMACVGAKEALSSDTETSIPVRLPGLETEVRMARTELEAALRPRLDDAVGALGRAVHTAGLDTDDLDAVVLVGGSSRIPLVGEVVASTTGATVVPGADPELAVAAGAALDPTRRPTPHDDTDVADDAEEVEARQGADDRDRRDTARPRARRRSDLRRIVTVAATGTSAVAAGVGGYLAYRTWWDDDADDPAEQAADAVAEDPEAFAELDAEDVEAVADAVAQQVEAAAVLADLPTLDEFDARAPGGGAVAAHLSSVPAATAGPSGVASAAATSAPIDGGARASAFAGSPRPTRPATTNEPAATPGPRPDLAAATTESTVLPPILSDPALEAVRAQLRERLDALDLPDGTDAADAERLRRDLDGLLDRFRAAPGQSVDEAVASLRYEFEDRMRDFAQDQRIDALIDEVRDESVTEEPAADEPEAVDETTPDTDDEPEAADETTPDTDDEPEAADREVSDPPPSVGDGETGVADVFDELDDPGVTDDSEGTDDTDIELAEPDTTGATDDDVAGTIGADGNPPGSPEAAIEDDVLGTDPVDPPELILTAPGVGSGVADAAPPGTHAANPDDGRLTRDLIPEVVGAGSVAEEQVLHAAIVPGGEFLDADDAAPAVPEPVTADPIDDFADDPLGV